MDAWPELPLADWADTCTTLQLWTRVVGKIRLAHAPMVNHWWQVPLYVNSRGLTTSIMPYGTRGFQLDFDAAADLAHWDRAALERAKPALSAHGC